MNGRLRRLTIALATAAALAGGAAHAKTFRVADQGDALSMDPHSLNESVQLSFTGNVYEPLVGRDKKLGLTPALATSWSQVNPTTWRFELRRYVSFHDNTPFTADDVVFTLHAPRAKAPTSLVREHDQEVKRIDDHTVDVITEPLPHPAGRAVVGIRDEPQVVHREQRRAPGGQAQGHREPRPRSAPTAPARSG
jgi:ABC-type transport system substrate-binding protein